LLVLLDKQNKPFRVPHLIMTDLPLIDNDDYLGQIQHDEVQLLAFIERIGEAARSAKESDMFSLGTLSGRAAEKLQSLQQKSSQEASAQRLVPTGFALNTPLLHLFDYDRFYGRIDDLFTYYNTTDSERKLAPYFPLIQSSGMGKTRLLVEVKHSEDEIVILLECKQKEAKEKELSEYFTGWFEVPSSATDAARDSMCNKLNELVETARKTSRQRVIILFDEAQHLLDKDGYAFRCVRWWLRRKATKAVVAIFAGTTPNLANVFSEPPDNTSSRDLTLPIRSGDGFYPPFYDICSIGIFGNSDTIALVDCEYENAIPYGRPLFWLMHLKKELTIENEKKILARMLLSQEAETWVDHLPSCYSILGTRVQMGHVSFKIASDVISKGYGGLTFLSSNKYDDIAEICFFPDPVCARLAMGMMIEECKLVKDRVGRDPAFWMNKATEMFSNSVCRPTKGDLGVVAGALYLLFCGDKIRYGLDRQLKHFTVPLDKWISSLMSPDHEVMAETCTSEASVNCIQVCRNYLRHSLKQMMDLLPRWYQSGKAMYAVEASSTFDLIVPIRYLKQGEWGEESLEGLYDYCPLLVNVKNQAHVSREAREASMLDMVAALTDQGIETGVCMLLLAGLERDRTTRSEMNFVFVGGGIQTLTVILPSHDPFGITEFLAKVSLGGGEQSEVYASHSEAFSAPLEIPTGDLLRALPSEHARAFLHTLRRQFKVGKEKRQKEKAEVGKEKRQKLAEEKHFDE